MKTIIDQTAIHAVEVLPSKVSQFLQRPSFVSFVSLLLFLLVPFAPIRGDEPTVIKQLTAHLENSENGLATVAAQKFAEQPITKSEAQQAKKLLVDNWKASIQKERLAEMKSGQIKVGKFTMPIFVKKFGEKPAAGWSLYISMHGGGGAPKRLNDQQWENQKRLYQLEEGIYVAPRAPTDTWNLWHQGHIDQLYDRLITNLIVTEGVNPNRVYIMGYSAGGDGVYQLAPRMSDRLAAAAMMAGHPNETSPLGLRNLPFTIHMGGNDSAYSRNKIAANWKTKLENLRKQDPDGYVHHVQIHEGLGHWVKRRDAVAIPWMAKHTRHRFPNRIVWKQDDVTHSRYYWLGVKKPKGRAKIVAEMNDQAIVIEESDVNSLIVLLNDEMLDLDQPVDIKWGTQQVSKERASRTIKNLATSLLERGDPQMLFSARVEVAKPEAR
jgi:predicted esterase